MLPSSAPSRRALLAAAALAAAPAAGAKRRGKKRRKPKPPAPLDFFAATALDVANTAGTDVVWTARFAVIHPGLGRTFSFRPDLTVDARQDQARAVAAALAGFVSGFLGSNGIDEPLDRIKVGPV